MATIESILPSFKKESMLVCDLRWSTEVDWDNDDFGFALLGLLMDSHNQEQTRPGGPRLLEMAKAACEDLVVAEHAAGISTYGVLLCRFLRFYVATGLMQLGCVSRQLSLLFDGVSLSLSDEPLGEEERIFHYGRLWQFLFYPEPSLIQGNAGHTFLEWTDAFYYYCRRYETHYLWVREIFANVVEYLLTAMQLSDVVCDAIPAALQVTAWGANHDLTYMQAAAWRKLVARLRELSFDDTVPAELQARLALNFTTEVGRKAGFDIAAEARSVLSKHKTRLTAHEPVQLYSAISSDGIEALRQVETELLEAIRSYRDFLSAHSEGDEDLLTRYDRGWVFSTIAPAVRCALLAGDTGLAARILSVWQGNERNEPVPERLLFIAAGLYGPVFALSGEVLQFITSCDEAASETVQLTHAANQFMGTRLGVEGDIENRALSSLGDLGKVAGEAGTEFCNRLVRSYRPEEVKAFVDRAGGCEAYCLIPHQQHPVTAILSRCTGLTLPYSVSLTRPQPDRLLRRAAIICFGSYTAEMEANAVTAILEQAGVRVECFNLETTVEILARCYASPAYDLIWVISHGEYDHYNPHRSYMDAGEEQLSLEMVSPWRIPSDEVGGRRLIVLNFCDSATTVSLGGLAEIGIGSLLARSNQAVIGHLWPAPFRSAAVYGALLAHSLANHTTDYVEGFHDSLTAMACGQECIASILSRYPDTDDLIAFARSVDWENIEAWGSPVFLQ